MTAQHILANHLREDPHKALRSPPVGQSTFWPDIHLDLSGAHLVDFVLTDSRLNVLDLNGATLTGETVLRGTQCDLALMQRMDVQGHADFRGTVFTNSAWIAYSTFGDGVWFHGDEFYPGARFGRHASFHGTTFRGNVRFGRAVFAGSVDFRETKWPQGTESIEFEDVLVENPEMTSPKGDAATNSWPEASIKPGAVHDASGSPTTTAPWNEVSARRCHTRTTRIHSSTPPTPGSRRVPLRGLNQVRVSIIDTTVSHDRVSGTTSAPRRTRTSCQRAPIACHSRRICSGRSGSPDACRGARSYSRSAVFWVAAVTERPAAIWSANRARRPIVNGPRWRVAVRQLVQVIDAMLATLSSKSIVKPLADWWVSIPLPFLNPASCTW